MSRHRKHQVGWLTGIIAIIVIVVGLFIYMGDSDESQSIQKAETSLDAYTGIETDTAIGMNPANDDEPGLVIDSDITVETDVAIDADTTVESDEDAVAEVDEDNGMEEALQLMAEEAYDEAVPVLLAIIENDPENADAYAWLSACYGSLIDEAGLFQKLKYNNLMEDSLEVAVSLDPESTLVHMVRGNRYLNAPSEFGGDVEKAIEDFLYCIENGRDDADIYFSLGQGYEKLGERSKAVQAYENALKQNPEHAEASAQLIKLDA